MPLRRLLRRSRRPFVSARQYFRTSGEIDGINAGTKRMVRSGNSHPGDLPGFIAAPIRPKFAFSRAVTNRIECNL